MSDTLASASSQFYGTAGPAFLEAFVVDREVTVTQLRELATEFANAVASDAGGQVQRVASRFGLIAAAGELAIEFRVLPWQTGAAISAASSLL